MMLAGFNSGMAGPKSLLSGKTVKPLTDISRPGGERRHTCGRPDKAERGPVRVLVPPMRGRGSHVAALSREIPEVGRGSFA